MTDASVCKAALRTFENGVFYCELPDGHIGLHCVRDDSLNGAPFFVVWAGASPKRRGVSIPTMQQDVPRVECTVTTGSTLPLKDGEYTVIQAINTVVVDDAEIWKAIAASECAILSEPVLAKEWNTPAEDEAWGDL